ncbi:hypothetical protein E1B28_006355 [Marasmius oreades]|uniref:Protein kinase domain-containing protein n=1 Tax=Marasmius oreades TaxID=181124 RepID=A0A9P7S5X2_9AGAR|nr:uncharacterized protein E1B28_006355 [Marasmius oreades]KAG7095632.1 hypothetical protein E1B28_006355 [Marasmius oreades]
MSTEYASQPPESKCGLDSHPKEEQHREDQYLERPYISSTNTERSTFQSRLTHNSTNACRLPTVTGQTSPSGSFFNPDAHSTPQIPFETVRFISRNPLLEDVPSISDESPDLRSSHASPGLSRNEQFDVSISGFTLVRTLGCGAYGKVLLGHLDSHYARNLHAIKFLRKGDMNRYGAEEVKRELRTLRWIADTTKSHTTGNRDVLFLQKMTQSFQNERYAFIVLEYHPVSLENLEIAGRLRLQAPPSSDSLSGSVLLPLGFSPSCLQGNARDPVVNLRFLAAELVLALRFLHGNGIVHQDVKPGNVMVSADGHIVLSDFGASIALPFSLDYDDLPVSFSPEVSIRKTYHPVVLQGDDIVTFTPSYAAPELLRRNGADLVIYDERVDWFSLGMLLYELATGSLPFQADYWAREPRIRRSTNDFSLAFGELENLSHASNNCGPDPSLKSIKPLESFLKAVGLIS